ncbi:hypothetical protein SEA_VANLEE_65 [Gordonia phage VanLee]|uniref:Uncharacterized protein n=1 Tax=Gordonia phage VanLee TaxID=2845816 RepID=A0A8F2D9G4_9CAUD|nr:hypothetical protein QEH49_gp065 [Gordonia phage VanLee]QWS68182.1 hypothetical protein SEA_VANLEE_65 [Gordonia phage VanLee]
MNPLIRIEDVNGAVHYVNALTITVLSPRTIPAEKGVRVDFGSTQFMTLSGYTVDEFAEIVRKALSGITH